MKNSALFSAAIAVAVVAIAMDVSYALPGFPHVLATNPLHGPYPKHLALFSSLAVVCAIAAFVVRIRSKPGAR